MNVGLSMSAGRVRLYDVGVVIWVVVWLALGVMTWHDIRAQAELSANVIVMGTAVRDTREALSLVGGLPLVGAGISDLADRITLAGTEVETAGRGSRDAIQRVAVIAGLGIGVLPPALVLLLYLPARRLWGRDRDAIARALSSGIDRRGLDRYLARRAMEALPWDELQALSPDPWRSVEDGEFRALADAELERMGLKPR